MLIRSGIIVSFLTLLSRLLGLARELFIAATFGSSSIADCVNVAFKFPNLFRRIFGEGALSAVFIPIFNQKLVKSRAAAKVFSGQVFVLLLLCLCIITIMMQIFMPYLMIIIAPGFYNHSTDKFNLAVLLCRITTPYLIFISITALFGGMTNSVQRFAAFAFTPIIMNICIIVGTILLQKISTPHHGIAISLIIAGILQVSFMFFCLLKAKLSFKLSFSLEDKSVRELIKNMGPATIGSGVGQLNLFISQSIASFLPGAISILSYADRLYQLPLALIGITFGTVLLPELSKLYQKQQYREANFLQNKAIMIALCISTPAMFGLILLAKPIIHIVYERGAFNNYDTEKTASALVFFAFGLPAFILTKILTPIFYANLDTKTPLKITVYSVVINIILNIVLMIPFGHVGIAAGSSIAAWINFFLLNRNAKNYGNFAITWQTKTIILRSLFSTIFMIIFIIFINHYYDYIFYNSNLLLKIIALLAIIFIAMVIFTLICYIQGIHKVLLKKYDTKISN